MTLSEMHFSQPIAADLVGDVHPLLILTDGAAVAQPGSEGLTLIQVSRKESQRLITEGYRWMMEVTHA